MDFEYSLLTNRDGPLARKEIRDLSELDKYMEILHDDFQLPGEEGGDGVRWHVNPERASMCTSGAASSRSCSGCHGLHVGIAHAPQGTGASTIWC